MDIGNARVSAEQASGATAETSWSVGVWFAFTYYRRPALLVGREARIR